MRAVVKKWGNSASVRIPAAVLKAARLSLNEPVDVREESGRIVIEPARRKEYDLAELLKGITRGNLHGGRYRREREMVMAGSYVSDAGDIVWVSFNPQAGREQAGHRPAVVLSPAAYNAKTSLMVCCPMTTQIKNYPFEVLLSAENPSVVLADQVRSLDWRKRRARRKGEISAAELAEVRAKIRALIG